LEAPSTAGSDTKCSMDSCGSLFDGGPQLQAYCLVHAMVNFVELLYLCVRPCEESLQDQVGLSAYRLHHHPSTAKSSGNLVSLRGWSSATVIEILKH
jgi:hypothetical protein